MAMMRGTSIRMGSNITGGPTARKKKIRTGSKHTGIARTARKAAATGLVQDTRKRGVIPKGLRDTMGRDTKKPLGRPSARSSTGLTKVSRSKGAGRGGFKPLGKFK